MKILLAGSEQRFSSLQDALNDDACEINEFKDEGHLIQEGADVADSYDWVILDGQSFKGEKDLARFLLDGHGSHSACRGGFGVPCGVDVSQNGTLEFFCGLQKLARGEFESAAKPDVTNQEGFVFEYHAPCRGRG